MNVTVDEFRALYPEFSGIAATSASVISIESWGRNLGGEPTFPEDLLQTICSVHTVEARILKSEGCIRSAPQWREVQYRSADKAISAEGAQQTKVDSVEYHKRWMRVMEDRSKAVDQFLAGLSSPGRAHGS